MAIRKGPAPDLHDANAEAGLSVCLAADVNPHTPTTRANQDRAAGGGFRQPRVAFVCGWGWEIREGDAVIGVVYPSSRGWLARDASGRKLGSYHKEEHARRAILERARRRRS